MPDMTKPTEPSAEMIEFFERRTMEHVERVRRCLRIMAKATAYGDELIARARDHDASKFGPEERVPYIWLTEFHRCRWRGELFEYPDGIEEKVAQAIEHHLKSNRHHPEFHADPNDMTDVDLIEMVCDWTAMAQEFDQDGGSARGWADKTIGHRIPFNTKKRQFIYQIIECHQNIAIMKRWGHASSHRSYCSPQQPWRFYRSLVGLNCSSRFYCLALRVWRPSILQRLRYASLFPVRSSSEFPGQHGTE